MVKKSLLTTEMTHSHSESKGILSLCETRWLTDKQKEVKAKSDLGDHKHVLCDKHKFNGKCLLPLSETKLKEPPVTLPCIVILALHETIVRCMLGGVK